MLMRCTVPVRSSWISRWAYYWLTVTIRAEWERIWIDDQEVAIVRDRFLNGRYVRIKFLCPGCRILHARGRTFVCRACALPPAGPITSNPHPPGVMHARIAGSLNAKSP